MKESTFSLLLNNNNHNNHQHKNSADTDRSSTTTAKNRRRLLPHQLVNKDDKDREEEDISNNNGDDEEVDETNSFLSKSTDQQVETSTTLAAASTTSKRNFHRDFEEVVDTSSSSSNTIGSSSSHIALTSSKLVEEQQLVVANEDVDDVNKDDDDSKMNSQKRKRSTGSGSGGGGEGAAGGGGGRAGGAISTGLFRSNSGQHGYVGLLSFLSAPLIGAMSDIWGRKVFLLITVFFTCLPIPLMRINPMWYFAMISISGLFAVTFSVVFAYVADVTDESNRTTAYGLVSATFAASLITSPALGSYLSRFYSENFVVALATAIAVFDMFFILVAVPESLPEKIRERSKGISWDKVDPFKSLRVIFKDRTITLLCITVFLSYLPEAGQYSCFFVYLKLIVGFSQQQVAYFIAYVGILSCIAQAAILVILIRYFGSRQSIIIGLTFQVAQLGLYAFAAQSWLIWFAGLLAAMSSIGYPAISAYISNQSHADQQGVSQGMVTGIRGLCNGIGPALYGFVFWIFRVNLNEASNGAGHDPTGGSAGGNTSEIRPTYASTHLLPGPPFLFGSVLALVAIFVTWLIPSSKKAPILLSNSTTLSSKYNKDNTLVKIGNTSSTYNRTSSSSSIHLPSDLKLQGNSSVSNQESSSSIYSKADLSNSDEIEHLLIGHQQQHDKFMYDSASRLDTVPLLISSSTSSNAHRFQHPHNYHHLLLAQQLGSAGSGEAASTYSISSSAAAASTATPTGGVGVLNPAYSGSTLSLLSAADSSSQLSHQPVTLLSNQQQQQQQQSHHHTESAAATTVANHPSGLINLIKINTTSNVTTTSTTKPVTTGGVDVVDATTTSKPVLQQQQQQQLQQTRTVNPTTAATKSSYLAYHQNTKLNLD